MDASDIRHDERDAMVRAALAEQGDSGDHAAAPEGGVDGRADGEGRRPRDGGGRADGDALEMPEAELALEGDGGRAELRRARPNLFEPLLSKLARRKAS